MGYSKSEACIARVKPLLDQLLQATADISWPSDNAHMLGYHIREALTVAKKNVVMPYHELKEKWIIRNKGNRIVAEIREINIIAALQKVAEKLTLEGPDDLVSIIGAAITHKAYEMYFPDVVLANKDLETLYQWCQKNAYFLVYSEVVGVTITRNDPQEAAWTPE